jgi:hypothetical protein
MTVLYEDVELSRQSLGTNYEPNFYDFNATQTQFSDYSRSELDGLGRTCGFGETHVFHREVRLWRAIEVLNQGEELENMYAPGCNSIVQALLGAEQAEEL